MAETVLLVLMVNLRYLLRGIGWGCAFNRDQGLCMCVCVTWGGKRVEWVGIPEGVWVDYSKALLNISTPGSCI